MISNQVVANPKRTTIMDDVTLPTASESATTINKEDERLYAQMDEDYEEDITFEKDFTEPELEEEVVFDKPQSKPRSRGNLGQNDDTVSVDSLKRYSNRGVTDDLKGTMPRDAIRNIEGSFFEIEKGAESKENLQSDLEDGTVISDVTDFTLRYMEMAGKGKRRAAPKAPEEDESCVSDMSGFVSMSGQNCKRHSMRTKEEGDAAGPDGTLQWELDPSAKLRPERSAPNSKGTSVGFLSVQVREYERILEFNPAVTSGAAIGIGWRYQEEFTIPIDDWEQQKDEVGVRTGRELIIPRSIRENMLKHNGYSQKEIANSTRIILKIKNQRKTTIHNLNAQPMEEALEGTKKRIKGILGFRKKK